MACTDEEPSRSATPCGAGFRGCAPTLARACQRSCQLRAGDVVQVDVIWCIKLDPEAGSLKTQVQSAPRSNASPSCDVYTLCFATYCPCTGADEDFRTYGKKYCECFLGLNTVSAAGVKWRDETLVCLEEAIVPEAEHIRRHADIPKARVQRPNGPHLILLHARRASPNYQGV